jgi:sialidase-1
MTVRLSNDGGRTWPISRVVYEGPSAYSSLAILGDKTVGMLYERGQAGPYERIMFVRFDMAWLAGK